MNFAQIKDHKSLSNENYIYWKINYDLVKALSLTQEEVVGEHFCCGNVTTYKSIKTNADFYSFISGSVLLQ